MRVSEDSNLDRRIWSSPVLQRTLTQTQLFPTVGRTLPGFTSVYERILEVPPDPILGEGMTELRLWIHGDLNPNNLLARQVSSQLDDGPVN